jgi:hypothetical protein
VALQVAGCERRADLGGEDEVVLLPLGPTFLLFPLLEQLVGFERAKQQRGEW